MQIDIRARDFDMTEALRRHAERRLRFSLGRCDAHIHRVLMRLSDTNGPRGGSDKKCHLQVLMAGIPDVVVEDIQGDLYVAIDRAADRARRTVVRKLGRRQTLSKQAYALA